MISSMSNPQAIQPSIYFQMSAFSLQEDSVFCQDLHDSLAASTDRMWVAVLETSADVTMVLMERTVVTVGHHNIFYLTT